MGFDALDWTALSNIGAGTALLFAIIAILKGWLVPRRVLEDRVTDKEKVIADVRAERDDWKSASRVKDDTLAIQARQIDELQEAARVTRDIVNAIPTRGRGG